MNIFKRFLANCRATTGIMFAVAAIPVFGAAGIAVDYARAQAASNEVVTALDAAVLATALAGGDEATRIDVGEKAFAANFQSSPKITVGALDIQIFEDGKVQGNVPVQVETVLAKVLGITQVSFNKGAEAQTAGLGKAEIALVLDYSSSMWGEYEAMRDGAIDLVNDLSENGTSTDVKFALVPFSKEVYATLPGQYVIGGTPGVPWSNCTVDRKWPYTVDDATPTGLDDSKWGRLYENETPTPAEYAADCTPYATKQLAVRPLSLDHAAVISQLQAMQPHAGTNIAVGMEFGHQVISPKAPWPEGVPYNDPDWRKVIILLTDGRHNKKGYGPGGIYTTAQGFSNVDTVCQNVKGKGVLVVTVAYELTDPTGKQQLKDCASGLKYYLEGDEGNIGEIFTQIGVLLGEVFLSR